MSGNGGGGDPPHRVPLLPTSYWDNAPERRLDYITTRLNEIVLALADASKNIRAQERIGDQQASSLARQEERLRDMQRELDDFPKKVERLASAEWAMRLETRVSNIEEESKSPFVRKSEFEPVKRAVFTMIGAICLAVLGAVAKMIMK